MHEDNDGRFPDDSPVEIRYPRSKDEEHGDRSAWPWLPGSILEQCGPDEWHVCVEVRELAVLRDGRRAPRGTASRNLYYPCCFRDSSEIRTRTTAMEGRLTQAQTAGRRSKAQAPIRPLADTPRSPWPGRRPRQGRSSRNGYRPKSAAKRPTAVRYSDVCVRKLPITCVLF
jgi:hypothetical protein